jgi:hypothetical protein
VSKIGVHLLYHNESVGYSAWPDNQGLRCGDAKLRLTPGCTSRCGPKNQLKCRRLAKPGNKRCYGLISRLFKTLAEKWRVKYVKLDFSPQIFLSKQKCRLG